MNKIIQSEIKDEVLEKVMLLFWRKGYFNTSIDNIVKETGMSRAVMYKYFKDKEGLFEAILNHYINNITSKAVEALKEKGRKLDPIYNFFQQFGTENHHEMLQYGCLLLATASDYPLHDERIKKIITSTSNNMEELFYNILLKAKESDVLVENIDCKTTASFLVGSLFGLMALYRSGSHKLIIDNFIKGICSYLNTLLKENK